MAEQKFTQDIRASLTLMITDDVLENNRVIVPADPERGVPATYAQWDDTIEGVRMNMHRDPENIYFYVPAGYASTENREINESFINDFLKGKRVVFVNTYDLMSLEEIPDRWRYNGTSSYDRVEVKSIQPTWRGYVMASQWYWLSDEEMLDSPEYIECACWSMPKP